MKYAFILARTVAFPIAVMCRVLGVSTSGFYAWRAKPESERDRRRRALTPEIRRIFEASRRTYGSPRVHRELRAEGILVNRKTVAAIMRSEGLVARPKRRFQAATDSQHDDPIAPNLVARNFTVNERDETWVGDVTAIWTAQGWLFSRFSWTSSRGGSWGGPPAPATTASSPSPPSETASPSDNRSPAWSTTPTAGPRTPAATTATSSTASASSRA